MPKTLADYSPEHRASFVGMWCDVEGEDSRVVLVRTTNLSHAILYRPSDLYQYHALINRITPLLDQPRAWAPDGEPASRRQA